MEDIDFLSTVNKFIEIARKQLNSMENKIKNCDVIGIIDSYALITTNLQNASTWVPELPTFVREEKMKEIHNIHDKKHDLLKTIPDFCRCDTKEAK